MFARLLTQNLQFQSNVMWRRDALSAVSDIYRIVVPLSLRAKSKRLSNFSERCNLENKSATSLRRGANLSRRDTHWHPRRLGSSATSPRRPETSSQVSFPQHFNILHWSNTYSQVIIFLASVPEVPFSNPDRCDVTRPEGFRVFYSSQSINRIVSSLLYLSAVDCHLLSPFPINVFHSSYRPQVRWIVSWHTHRCRYVCVLCRLGGRNIHARLASGRESAVWIPLGCESCCGSPRILLKFGVLQKATASILWLIVSRKMADQGEKRPR